MSKKICVVTPYNLFTARHGNAIRVRKMIEFLTSDNEVSLLMYDLPSQSRIKDFKGTKTYFFKTKYEVILASAIMRLLFKASTYDFFCAKLGPFYDFSRNLEKIVDEDDIELFQCENMPTVPPVLNALREKIPLVVTAHDVLTDRFDELYQHQKVPRFLSEYLRNQIREIEVDSINLCDVCVCVSEYDRARFLEMGVDPDRIRVIPNGVDTHRIRPMAKDGDLLKKLNLDFDDFILFFAGSDMYQNRDAVDNILEIILHQVLKRSKKIKFLFLGSICPYVRKRVPRDLVGSVRIVGYVDDLLPYYSIADAVVIPIQYGTGTKLKTVEAMAAGKAVVTTAKGVVGLNVQGGVDVLVDDIGDFHEQIIELMGDEDYRVKLGENARKKSLQYDWGRLIPLYKEIYEKLI